MLRESYKFKKKKKTFIQGDGVLFLTKIAIKSQKHEKY